MKNCISLLITNSILLALLYVCGYLYPEYSWSIKSIFYFLIGASIIGRIYYIAKMEELTESLIIKFSSNIYNILDIVFDLLFLYVFVLLDYRLIFVLYLFDVALSITLKAKFKGYIK